MKVKDLIKSLEAHNPDDNVAIWLSKDECWKIDTVDTEFTYHYKNPLNLAPYPGTDVVHLHIHEDCNYEKAIARKHVKTGLMIEE